MALCFRVNGHLFPSAAGDRQLLLRGIDEAQDVWAAQESGRFFMLSIYDSTRHFGRRPCWFRQLQFEYEP